MKPADERSETRTAATPSGPTTPAAGSDQNSTTDAVPSRIFYKATSFLSIWGPCRRVGDEYLSCVTTEGMGMCKPLRRHFEQCASETSGYSIAMLDQLAIQACSHVDAAIPEDKNIVKRNCAAEFMLRQQNGPQQS